MSTRIRYAVVGCLLLAGSILQAGEERIVDEATLRSRIVAEERESELRAMGLGRLRLSLPQRFSVGFGAIFARQPKSYGCHSVCDFEGWLIQAEPGLSGGQLSVGYAHVMAETGAAARLLSKVHLAYGVRAALLRTWNGADLTPSDQTLAGLEGDFTVIGVSFSLGAFRRVGSGDPGDDWLLTGGIGWGF